MEWKRLEGIYRLYVSNFGATIFTVVRQNSIGTIFMWEAYEGDKLIAARTTRLGAQKVCEMRAEITIVRRIKIERNTLLLSMLRERAESKEIGDPSIEVARAWLTELEHEEG